MRRLDARIYAIRLKLHMNPEPFAPAGAPLRPLGSQMYSILFAALVFALLTGIGLHVGFRIVGVAGLVSLVAVCLFTKRKWDRIGWYELRPVAQPSLPFRARRGVEAVTFKGDGIQFSGWRRHRFISYGEIRRVETLCFDTRLVGVQIWLTDHDYHRTDNAPELIRERSISGQISRQILALLRQQAPHAQFCGPQWIEEGWMPRVGFTLIYPASGASGGP